MSWAELDWPDLSPAFPEPRPASPPPPRPVVPLDIAEQVRNAEKRRGVFVPLCALAGAALLGAGLALYRLAGSEHSHSFAALALMGAGLIVAFVVPALVVLLVIGPKWQQRTQHLQLIRWEQERGRWRTRERDRYIMSLSPPQRELLQQTLASTPVH